MLKAARPPLVRLAALDYAIRGGDYPNASTLALQLEVSRRTVQRDVEFLRDQLKAPLHFDSRRNGYCYTRADFCLPFFRISQGELIALFVSQSVLRQCHGTPFEPDLRRAVARLATMLPEQVSVDLGSLPDTLSVLPTAVTLQDLAIFTAVAAATTGRRQLQLDYWTASRNAQTRRVVDPVHLTLIDGSWFLIGWCHLRRGLRMFAVQRIRAASETGQTFERPAGFQIQEFLRGSFRAMRGDDNVWHKIILRFSPAVAGRVAERIWHPSQKTERCGDGTLQLQLELTDLREVLRWVLSWGRDCKVEGPPQLVHLVSDEITAMLPAPTLSLGPLRGEGEGVRGGPTEPAEARDVVVVV